MSQVCGTCAHANPPEAIYCHFDGVVLAGHSANGRAIQAGSQPFPSEFVFSSGLKCRNFDQLAMACQQNWSSAVEFLKQGILASFLGGVGRGDLALAAKQAARFPDSERGLDQLLAKLPTQVLDIPKLRAEPTEMNLGVVPFGTNRSFELHLSNLGMRLLYGSVASDSKWLTLGDAPGNQQKVFQFGGDGVIHVQVRGQHLRAGNKPLEGHLLIESNGGTATLTVRADVPPRPYPGDVLGGATTPRQIAEKALAAPREAAPLFESGAVAKWFASNGWTYPVRGPSASGVGAVQQFFEALGLSKAPKVEISPTALALRGEVGQPLQAAVELKTQEKRPVYGHAVCDQPWLDVSRTQLSGRNAIIHVSVPRVPNRPGETLQANVNVTSNGNQKFKVPVSLEIGGTPRPSSEAYAVVEPIPVPAAGQPVFVPLPTRSKSGELPVAALLDNESPRLKTAKIAPAATMRGPLPADSMPVADLVEEGEPAPTKHSMLLHALPAGFLSLFLLAVLVHDFVFAPTGNSGLPDDAIPIDPNPRIAVFLNDSGREDELKIRNGLMTFGLTALNTGNMAEKKLTYDLFGRTNSTLIRINGEDFLFGAAPGKWIAKSEKFGNSGGTKSVWFVQKGKVKIEIAQFVEIVPGDAVEDKQGKLKRYRDTCLIRYVFENKGPESARVGLRLVLDTLIGQNDGVPFTVPGQRSLVDKNAQFTAKQMPDFIQVLENPDLFNPGVVAFVGLKVASAIDPPDRLLLTQWQAKHLDDWELPAVAFDKDSAVVLYWNPLPLKPGATRQVGFTYGLGNLATSGGKLGITVGGSATPGGDMTVVALVNDPKKDQMLTLKLPPGVNVIEGELKQTVQPVPLGASTQQSPVTWRIRAEREGTYVIEVLSSTGGSQKKTITVKAKTIF